MAEKPVPDWPDVMSQSGRKTWPCWPDPLAICKQPNEAEEISVYYENDNRKFIDYGR